ncbi:MAG: sigma factor-like helix-turn-helix DNA-binding protein [Planctomycetota bacterium]
MDVLDRLIVREMVASLPERQRELAELLMEGHSQASAARALGVTPRAVRYRIKTLRALLRRRGESVIIE